jgi:hypothetical protein
MPRTRLLAIDGCPVRRRSSGVHNAPSLVHTDIHQSIEKSHTHGRKVSALIDTSSLFPNCATIGVGALIASSAIDKHQQTCHISLPRRKLLSKLT